MKALNINKIQNKLRNKFLKSGVKMNGPETIFFSEDTKIGKNVTIEPYVVFGKNVKIGKKSKVNHLSYVGDSEIGKSVNIGAGTITCNYDGVKKSKTKIKDNVFIGSNSSLVAPVTIDSESVVGAGSVITKNVKKKSLALTRSIQTEIMNYKRKVK
ncbi:UDP-N-acetylglucosamine pyrophosphorylase [Candidatus Pelagibacter sp.]|nr:UDP-N-acetylglucosamine pyrophosphorylase [Candidatus Pelagibacter sp.]